MAARWTIEGTGRMFTVLLTVFVAPRLLGPSAWGSFWGLFGMAFTAVLLTDLGGHLNLARRTAALPARARGYLAPALRTKNMLAAAVLGLWAATSPLLPGVPPALGWMLVLGALALSYVEMLGCFLRGIGRVLAEAGLLAADSVLACAFGLAALAAGAGAGGLAGALLAGHAVALVAAWTWLRIPAPGSERVPPGTIAAHLRGSVPLAVALLAMSASWRLGAIALPVSGWTDPASTGCYAAVHRLFEAARFFPAVAAAALFPAFARRGASPWPLLRWLVPASVAGAGLIAWSPVAERATMLVFGPAYAGAAPILSVAVWAIPLLSVSAPLTARMVAQGHTGAAAWLAVLHLSVHAVCLWNLARTGGAAGAAVALVLAEAATALAAAAMTLLHGGGASSRRLRATIL